MTPPALEVEYHGRTEVRTLVGLGLFTAGYVVAWAVGLIAWWLGLIGTVLFGGVLLFALLTSRRSGRPRPAALLDSSGITVVGTEVVPGSALRAVVLSPMRPIWFMGTRRVQVVSFLPRPGADLPGPPQPGRRPQSWGRHLRVRLYGTNLTLLASATTVGGEEIARVAHDLGGLPVVRVPYQGVLRWAVVLGGALLLGLVIGLLAHLVG